jgi:tripartite motif-containing protein 71
VQEPEERVVPRQSLAARALLALAAAVALAACGVPSIGLHRPNGVALAPDGTLFIMDRANYRVAHLAQDGRLLGSIGVLGTSPGAIHSGWDIALDSAGNIYICNLIDDEAGGGVAQDGVKVFTPAGALVREVGVRRYDTPDEPHNAPFGLDIDAADRLYVADSGAGAVRVFDRRGVLLGRLFGASGDGPGEFRGARDVVVDDARGLLYVSDSANSRVQQFRLAFGADGAPAASFVRSIGRYGSAAGRLSFPQNLAVDEASGQLLVGDLGNRRVQVFDAEGAFVRMFSVPGVRDWQVMGIAVAPDGGALVADAVNDSVWLFDADGRRRQQLRVRL